jgi:hypothetical protein
MHHKTKKKNAISCIIGILIFCSGQVQAQYFYNDRYYNNPVLFEIGGSVGAVNCLTDIGGTQGIGAKFTKDLNLGNTQVLGGLYVGALINQVAALRLELSFGRLSAYDSILSKVPLTNIARARYNRNLSFRTNITEVAVIAEFHPLFAFIDWSSTDRDAPRFSPYLLAGVSYFKFNPQANLAGQWVDLQPLSTEGQGFAEYPDRQPYKLNGIGIPVGLGLKYELSAILNMRAEFVYRPTNTDYLDDVSKTYIDKSLYSKYLTGAKLNNALLLTDRQRGEYLPQTLPDKKRGDSKNNDNYFSFNLKLGLVLGRQKQ